MPEIWPESPCLTLRYWHEVLILSQCTDILSEKQDPSQPDHEVFLANCIMESNKITIGKNYIQLHNTSSNCIMDSNKVTIGNNYI